MVITGSSCYRNRENDNDEIAAGNQLGCTTVQTLRPGVKRDDEADHHIGKLYELAPLLNTD